MKISILGAGNVATQLALALKKAGHEIVQIYNRSDDAGKELALTVAGSFTSDCSVLAPADIYLIAVKDDGIHEVAAQLRVRDKIVAHTSGTMPKDILKNSSTDYGIFYPLQTMTKVSKVNFKNVPLLIEGNNEVTTDKLELLAKSISQNVHRVSEEQRQWIHIAAVFANNFPNYLFVLADRMLEEQGLSFEILKPLIFSFIQNLQEHSPSEMQTGPAIRGDQRTIEQHILLLRNNPELQKIYQLLTTGIMRSAGFSGK